jgi:hypothetical protein
MSFLSEIWAYLRERKKIWLVPVFIFLIVLGLVWALGAATGLGSLIYPVF